MEEALALLDRCSDLVLRCSDGTEIPCVTFQCVRTCEVIRHVMQDVPLSRDPRGRSVIPFPNVDSTDLALAAEVVHEVRAVDDLVADAIPSVLRGLRALGHVASQGPVMERLWSAVKGCSEAAIRPHLTDLLHTPSLRCKVLQRMVRLCPTWGSFSATLDHVLMDVQLAAWLMLNLSRRYPAGPLFTRLVGMIPAAVLDGNAALGLFVSPGVATAFHPAEAVDALETMGDTLGRCNDSRAWAGVRGFAGAMLQAMQVYDVAPHVANALHGSVVLLENCPMASVLLHVGTHKPLSTVSRKMSPWLHLYLDFQAGAVDALVTLRNLDDQARTARRCQVRVTAYAGDVADVAEVAEVAEVWYDVEGSQFSVPADGRVVAGCPDSVRNAVRRGLSRLRLDVFYGHHNVLDHPCFLVAP